MDLDQRLVNWGRVVRVYPNFGHCFSIEYRYKAKPQPPMSVPLAEFLYKRGLCSKTDLQNAYDIRQQARSEAPDRMDAETVEQAWSMIPNASCKALLRMFYVKRRQPLYIAKRLGVEFDYELMISQAAIEIELIRNESKTDENQSSERPPRWFNLPSSFTLHGSLAGA